tara:strand:- start:49 stop:444 length:396 start_codon:yes stop_codon:yes gene_type:complete
MKNILRENMRRFATKNLNEQAERTIIAALQLKSADIKRVGDDVIVSFKRNDAYDSSYSNLTDGGNGTCKILLFKKKDPQGNYAIGYANVSCVTEFGEKWPEMQKWVEYRLDLPAPADTNNFSQNILTAFEK